MAAMMSRLRENALLSYFARHRVAANLLMVFSILLGGWSATELNTQIFPDVSPGISTVSVTWSGADANAVLEQVTQPLERQLENVDGVERIRSNTRDGNASLRVTFEVGADIEQTRTRVRSAVESVSLPGDADTPRVEAQTFSETILFVIFSYDGNTEDLRPLMSSVEDALEQRGIPEVSTQGLQAPITHIEVTPETLVSQGWTLQELAGEIRGASEQYSAGQAGLDENRRTLIVGDRIIRVPGLRELALSDNRTLGQIATIEGRGNDPRRILRFDGRSALLLEVGRSRGMDAIETSDIYREWHNEFIPTLPDTVDVYIFSDGSEFVSDNIELLVSNGLMGLALVLITLFVFLNLRVAFWTAMGIPVAILATMALLYATGGSLNFFSMFAMLMALGIIVDNAIVIGEETQSMTERGVANENAASMAVSRLYAPIIASSLTTMAAFFPLLVVPGVFGELLRPIPLVIIFVLVAALIECFFILPGHLHGSFTRGKQRAPTRFRNGVNRAVEFLREQLYRPLMRFTLHNRMITVSVATSLLIISGAMVAGGHVPFSMNLQVEAEEVFADASFLESATDEDIEQVVASMREGLSVAEQQIAQEYGLETPLVRDFYYEYDLDAKSTFFLARLPSPDDRPFSNDDFLTAWDNAVPRDQSIDRLSISGQGGGGADSSQLTLRLSGPDSVSLRNAIAELENRLIAEFPDLRNFDNTLPATNTERRLTLSPEARAQGMTAQGLAGQLQPLASGVAIQSYNEFGTDAEIRLRLDEETRSRPGMIDDLPIRLPNGSWLPLRNLASVEERQVPTSIVRDEGRQAASLTADPANDEVDTRAIQREIQRNIMPQIEARYSVSTDYQTGEDAAELLNNLVVAAWAALLLIFIILAWMFQSYSWPIAVMTAIPFAMTGAVAGHWLLGLDLNFLSLFGLFGLAGIVINGSIILISRYRELLAEGMGLESALIEASCQRFRPVTLTTLTTVMGLVPVLLETSVQAQLIRSMATSLAFGLGYGAILVLLVIPCVLSLLQSLGNAVSRLGRLL